MSPVVYVLNFCNFLTSLLEVQDALQWWHYRQSLHIQRQVEQIREGLLQEVFSVRRSIELLKTGESSRFDEKRQHWLAKVEEIHRSLEQLSHRLSPFYVEESLPLAIQYGLDQQQQINSEVSIELPHDWTNELPERNRVILIMIDELLRIASPPLTGLCLPLRICLKTQNGLGELAVQISYPDRQSIASCCNSKELRYLEQSFRLLTSGWCLHRRQGLMITWYFYWRLNTVNAKSNSGAT